MKTHYTYFGHIIHVYGGPGHRLRYSSVGVGVADTLAGIKRLIKQHVKSNETPNY